MSNKLIILSGTYISDEFSAEIGKIPHSFLPVLNRRLFEHQIELYKKLFTQIYLVLPEDLIINDEDQKIFDSNNINILKINSNLNIGQAINTIKNYINDNEITLLYGDTLIYDNINLSKETYYIANSDKTYNWHYINEKNDNKNKNSPVLAGLFNIKNFKKFLILLNENNYDIFKTLYCYKEIYKVELLLCNKWFDFGHILTYFDSIKNFTTERVFNKLNILDNIVYKKVEDIKKGYSEYAWYKNLPVSFLPYHPIIIDASIKDNVFEYSLEYLPYFTLNNLLVFGQSGYNNWEKIINNIFSFINLCQNYSKGTLTLEEQKNTYITKTIVRLDEFYNYNIDNLKDLTFKGYSIPDIKKIILEKSKIIVKENINKNIIHGDLCFSNILFNFRENKINLIDPRGITPSGNSSIYGDTRYDIAKLYQCIIGKYDFIVANRFSLTVKNNIVELKLPKENDQEIYLKNIFLDQINLYTNIKDIKVITSLLFLSMIPLHSESFERQLAFLYNGINLLLEVEE